MYSMKKKKQATSSTFKLKAIAEFVRSFVSSPWLHAICICLDFFFHSFWFCIICRCLLASIWIIFDRFASDLGLRLFGSSCYIVPREQTKNSKEWWIRIEFFTIQIASWRLAETGLYCGHHINKYTNSAFFNLNEAARARPLWTKNDWIFGRTFPYHLQFTKFFEITHIFSTVTTYGPNCTDCTCCTHVRIFCLNFIYSFICRHLLLAYVAYFEN